MQVQNKTKIEMAKKKNPKSRERKELEPKQIQNINDSFCNGFFKNTIPGRILELYQLQQGNLLCQLYMWKYKYWEVYHCFCLQRITCNHLSSFQRIQTESKEKKRKIN